MARESSPGGPEGEATFTPPVAPEAPESETTVKPPSLKEARANVGAERAGERTRLRDTEGVLKTEETLESTTANEEHYKAALNEKVTEKAREMQRNGESREDILKYIVDQISREQSQRERAE